LLIPEPPNVTSQQGLEAQLSERLHVNVGWVERQLLAAPWAFAVEALNDFVWWSKFNAFIENCATL